MTDMPAPPRNPIAQNRPQAVATEYAPVRPINIHRSYESAAVDIEQEIDQLQLMMQQYIDRSKKLAKELREMGKLEAQRKFEFMNDMVDRIKATLYLDNRS